VPDDKWGEVVVGVVQPREGATPDAEEVIAAARTKVAGYKAPREIVLVDELVRSPAGKPDYKAARSVAVDRLGG